jgi:hypothetical protein
MNSMVWKAWAPPKITFFCMAINPKLDFDDRMFGKERVAKMSIVATLPG